MTTWRNLRAELNLSEMDEQIIEYEKQLIKSMVKIREEKGMTQKQVASICGISQPLVARLECASHSPQLDSLLRVLVPLGYTIEIVPITKK